MLGEFRNFSPMDGGLGEVGGHYTTPTTKSPTTVGPPSAAGASPWNCGLSTLIFFWFWGRERGTLGGKGANL